MSNAVIISKWVRLDAWDVNKQFGTWKEEGWNKIRYFSCLILIFLKWSAYDKELQIKNTSGSDPCSYEATKAVTKKVNLSFCCFSCVIVRVREVFGKTVVGDRTIVLTWTITQDKQLILLGWNHCHLNLSVHLFEWFLIYFCINLFILLSLFSGSNNY